MNVYVVTSGCYSDYKIEAVFSTEERATAFKAELDKTLCDGQFSDIAIEAWELDARAGEENRPIYHAEIDLKTGAVQDPWMESRMVSTRARAVDPPDESVASEHIAYGSSAVSAKHAMKLAVEARQAWLREKATKAQQQAEVVALIKAGVAKDRAAGIR